jgi:hypothetical protein
MRARDLEEKFLPFTFLPKTGPIKQTSIYTEKFGAIPGWDNTTWSYVTLFRYSARIGTSS